jgi:hypothetical protein
MMIMMIWKNKSAENTTYETQKVRRAVLTHTDEMKASINKYVIKSNVENDYWP